MTAPTPAELLARQAAVTMDAFTRAVMTQDQLAEWNNARLRTDLEASVRHEEDKE